MVDEMLTPQADGLVNMLASRNRVKLRKSEYGVRSDESGRLSLDSRFHGLRTRKDALVGPTLRYPAHADEKFCHTCCTVP